MSGDDQAQVPPWLAEAIAETFDVGVAVIHVVLQERYGEGVAYP